MRLWSGIWAGAWGLWAGARSAGRGVAFRFGLAIMLALVGGVTVASHGSRAEEDGIEREVRRLAVERVKRARDDLAEEWRSGRIALDRALVRFMRDPADNGDLLEAFAAARTRSAWEAASGLEKAIGDIGWTGVEEEGEENPRLAGFAVASGETRGETGDYVSCVIEKLDTYHRQRIALLDSLVREARGLSPAAFAEKIARLYETQIDRGCDFGPNKFLPGATLVSLRWDARCLDGSEAEPLASDGTAPPHQPAVGALLYDDGRRGPIAICTGTLVAPNAVLTAAHCFCKTGGLKDRRGTFHRTAAGCARASRVHEGRRVGALDPVGHSFFLQHVGRQEIERVVIPPDYRWPRADLALLILREPVVDVAPLELNTARRLTDGDSGVGVGFGAYNPIGADGGPTSAWEVNLATGLKLQGQIEVGHCSQQAFWNKLICWRYGRASAGRLLGSICHGDSGGPLIVTDNRGQRLLAGVATAGGPSCRPGAAAYEVDVFGNRNWLKRTLARHPPSRASVRSGNPRQVICYNCRDCGAPGSRAVEGGYGVRAPRDAGRLRVSVNCTPTAGELRLTVAPRHAGAGDDMAGAACDEASRSSVQSCVFPTAEGREYNVRIGGDPRRDCQIVVTALD